MGCDIHSYVELKNPKTGVWEKQGELFPVPAYMEDFYKEHYGAKDPVRIEHPFDERNYEVFAFLADVRNYAHIPPISGERGLPDDCSEEVRKDAEHWGVDGHTHSWLSVRELAEFDYSASVENRRTMREIRPNFWDGAQDAGPGNGVVTTWAEFLGEDFMRDLNILKGLEDMGECRIVFWFDN